MSRGLTVRWSLQDAPEGVEDALASYVAESSHARFTGLAGLAFKTWRMRAGEWFEGCYVFIDDAARTAFQESFTAGAEESPGSRITGAPPILIEECEIVAIAEGGEGFAPICVGEPSGLGGPDLLGAKQAVADRQQHGNQ